MYMETNNNKEVLQFMYDYNRNQKYIKFQGEDARMPRDRIGQIFNVLNNRNYPTRWQNKI